MSERIRARVAASAVALLLATLAAAAPAAGSGRLITVGVFGDSVAEGYFTPHWTRDALVPQLVRMLAAHGDARGAVGLVPPIPFRWHFNRITVTGHSIPADGWLDQGWTVAKGVDGPSGYSAVTVSPLATASTVVDAALIGVLYDSGPTAGPFTVTIDGRPTTIDPQQLAAPAAAVRWIAVPPGRHTVTVGGPAFGELSFAGIVARTPPAAGVEVEVEDLGHAAHSPQDDLAPRVEQSLALLRVDVSLFLWGYTDELSDARGRAGYGKSPYARAIAARAALTHRLGGLCLIADPSPLAVSPRVRNGFSRANRVLARRVGCAWTGAMRRLWDPLTSIQQQLTLVDDVHPTAAGYHLMVRALARPLQELIAQRLRQRA